MNWKQYGQLILALVILFACIWMGRLVWPALQVMAPVLAWTILIAVEIIVISVAIGVPAGIVVFLRGHHRVNEAKVIEARKLPANERGFMYGYVSSSPKDRILVPQLSAYSVEVPGSVHIEEDHSNSAMAANDLRERQFEWKKHIDMLRLNPPQSALKDVVLPDAPPFRQVVPYIKDDQVVLGFGESGAVLGKVLDWLSTLIVGRPGNGKSTGLYFFIAQLMMLNARFQVLDPHGTLLPLKEMLPYVNRNDGCINMAPVIEQELEDRMARYEANGSRCEDEHYMLIVDELPSIADREQQLLKRMDKRQRAEFRSLIDVIRRVVCEGRKYKMYCMVVGQSIPASILPTIARDNMSTRYVFYCSEAHARMAGLDNRSIEEMLPALQGAVGKCIIAPARMQPFIGAIPFTEEDDLRYVIDATGYVREGYDDYGTPLPDTDETPVVDGNITVSAFPGVYPLFPGNGNAETVLPDGITDFQLEQIEGMYKANWPLREIAKMVHLSGRNYWKFQAACEYLGIAQKQEA